MISQKLERLLRQYKYATANKVAENSKATRQEREVIRSLARQFGNTGSRGWIRGNLKEYNTDMLRSIGIEEII